MFGFIKHGEKEEEIVNLNCKIYHLLSYIKRKCEFKDDFELDLCDLNGDVKHLNENQEIYANAILKDREELVLVRLERKVGEPKPNYIPLLNDNFVISEDFLNKLNFSKKAKTPTSSKPKVKPSIAKKKTTNNISNSPEGGSQTPASPSSGHASRNKSPQKS